MSYAEQLKKTNREAAALAAAIPETLAGFQALKKAADKPGELSAKMKELMSLAIAISQRCEGCIVFHAQAAIRHGATRAEVAETIGVAVAMGGGPSVVYGAKAMGVFDELSG